MSKKRINKYIAIAVMIALVAELAIVTFPKQKKDMADQMITQQDQQIAADLSNLTGVTADQIIKIKQTGITWNEVSERLKDQTPENSSTDKQDRSSLLNEAGIGEELLEQLRRQGFKDGEIMEAKLLTERVMQQLKEIQDKDSVTGIVQKPAAGMFTGQTEDSVLQEAYSTINGRFVEGQAVRLLLTLQKDFGSMESVMNEYLLTLQTGLELEMYLTDKKKYLENKEEHLAGLQENMIVTMELLEKAMLEQLQPDHSVAGNIGGTENTSSDTTLTSGADAGSPLPEIVPPSPGDVMPQSPAEAVREEIQAIDPNRR
ncbi:hypothetical protein [Paenibacillus sp. MMS20-IR301]|uniref:hypothetical protein n=1 Tax=Paenibacillus sp. MMS20-IR301 TaxID=2895946 RepID=UPI0028F03C75|nr:hypothetical protein [Paenibacillus sp. MMS20-IR301]WNS43265.1 hypothetical protein LOS79_30730 [Paenibacillus sp. MMS20-IR301]